MPPIRYSVLLVLVVITGVHKSDATCEARYQTIPDHTACKTASADVVSSGISEADKTAILNKHNDYRAGVSPTATNMLKLVWDDDLQVVAQAHANTCVWGHDENFARRVPGRYSAGQNLAGNWPTKDWPGRIDAWYNEESDFVYGSGAVGGAAVGHYTQVVWAETHKIGCGYSECHNLLSGGTADGHYYVCNYSPAGNSVSSQNEPYVSGTSCDVCPISCSNNLCDCPTQECLNGGTFDIDACTCTCIANSPYYVEANCALNCTDIGTPSCSFGVNDCPLYSNVPDLCPVTCGFCPGADSTAGGSGGGGTTTTTTTTTTTAAGGDNSSNRVHIHPVSLMMLLIVILCYIRGTYGCEL